MNRITICVIGAAALFLLVSCAAKKEEVISAPPKVEVEVVELRITENQEHVTAKVFIKEKDLNALDPSDVYLLDEASGRKYPVVRLQRIGKLAEFPGEQGVRHIMFWNNEGGLKVGKLVTISLGKHHKKQIRIR
ncbi:MAG: hypothetical protein FWH25_04200 [Syntrophorhabdaceae bacterium]|nr:hypothetical protein [Syntrophorhabdaceae bacterium]